MKVLKSCMFVIVFLLLFSVFALGQGVGSSGNLSGRVTDSSGAVLANANVVATQPQTGLQRSAKTDSAGQYRLPGLAPGNYDVSAQVSGFQTQMQKGVAITVGETSQVNFRLQVGQVSTQVTVTSEAPIIDTTEGKQANTIGQTYVTSLPIDRRDYLNFTLLLPGVSNSTQIASNADFRVKQTPQSGLSFYGSNGRGNSVTVDGGETNDDAGGVRLNVSQDAVQEFQINRSNYSSELGSASGASINIVTKSGTNTIHGGLFAFFRNDAMDARDPFAFSPALVPGQTFSLTAQGQPVKNSLSRQQFGATLGFPIKKNKTFAFLSYEGLRSDAQDSVPLLTTSSIFAPTAQQAPIIGGLGALGTAAVVPCLAAPAPAPPGTFVRLPAATCAFALQSLLTVNPNPGPNPFVSPAHAASNAFIVNQFEQNGGLFPFPIRQHQGSIRLDHQFDENNQLSLRYNAAHLDEKSPDVQALTGFSRGSSILNWDSNLLASYFHLFSAQTQNELRLQWNMNQFNVVTNDLGGPGLDVQGFGFFGRGIFLPSFTRTRRYEIADNLNLTRGSHNMKMGFYELIRGNKTTSQTFFAGRFEFLQLPGGLLSPCLQIPALCGLPANTPSAPISTLQSWSLGLPAFYEQGFGNPTYANNRPFTAVYWQDSWRVRPNFTLNYGLRYEVDSQYGQLNTDKDNFAPRLSFAWDPFASHRTVIRGGYGIFYSPIYAQIPNVVQTLGNINNTRQIANTLVSILGAPGNAALNSATIYQTLLAQGKILCGTPPAGANACITPNDLKQFGGFTVANSGPLPPGTVLFAGQKDYQSPYSQQASLGIQQELGPGFTLSLNYIYVHTQRLPWAVDTNLLPGAPIVTGTGADGLPTNGLPFQNWGALACEVNPGLCFADPTHTILQNNVYSSIAAAIYHGGLFEVQKRFSNRVTLLGNYTYSRAVDDATDFNSDYSAFNQVNLRAERGLSDFDQRHKVTFAGVFTSPWDNSKVLGGFELSPIVSYNSGHPFNLLAGSDINGDGHFTNDRPPGAGRNTGIGPDYVTLNLRLGRAFKIGEKSNLQFTAEGFNLTNRTNYASVNNIVGSNFGPAFKAHGTALLSPSQPLGFTSAFPKREIQLGLRLSF
ncbi:MAG TPA: carboxypeptidase regulatory-like domain-containing protein [Terriglobales bacterium]